MQNENVSQQDRFSLSWHGWVWIPLLLIVGAVPLCMYLRVIPITPDIRDFWTGATESFDFFSFYRSRWIVILTALGTCGFLARFPQRRRTWFSLLLGVYAFLAIVSTVFSQRPWTALDGAPTRFEGTLILVSYAIIAFLAMNEADRPGFPKKLLTAALVGCFIMCVFGFFQFINHDVFRTLQGKYLVMANALHNRVQSLEFSVTNGFIYGLLPNPNYAGSYTAMMMAVTFGLAWLMRGKVRWVILLLHLLVYVNWLGCRSRAGLLGGVFAIAVLFLIGRGRWRENLRLLGVLLLSYVFIAFWMDYVSLKTPNSHRLFENFTVRRLSHQMPVANEFKDLILATDSFELIYTGNRMLCEIKDGKYEFRNRDGKIVPYEWSGQQLKFPKNEFLGFVVAVATESKVFQISRLETTINLMHTKQGFMYIDEKMRLIRFRKIPRFGFEGRDQWGSMRGFVWSRSFPLLWEAMFVGYGPDMFLFHFPQDDYLEKLKSGIPLTLIFDKPHNVFLQIGINTGGLSLLTVLVLFGAYLIQSLRLFWHARFEDTREIYGVCLAAAVGSYLVAGVFNDSTVSVSPIFWAFLGTGIGLNLVLAESSSEHARESEPMLSTAESA